MANAKEHTIEAEVDKFLLGDPSSSSTSAVASAPPKATTNSTDRDVLECEAVAINDDSDSDSFYSLMDEELTVKSWEGIVDPTDL